MKTLDSMAAELAERDAQLADVCRRLAHAHDTLIHVARYYHRVECHRGATWTDCQDWPCRDIGREITRRIGT